MAAKLLHSLADDNPDLQKQIGCMTGIFQIFDRQQVGRHLNAHSHPRLLPPGNPQLTDVGNDFDDAYNQQERATYNDKRVSAESFRASFSSSSRSSSFSSLDYGKISHPEPSLMDRIVFPETPSRDPVITQPSGSPKFGRLSLDLRDVVKDSMYRETRGSSVQTTMKEVGSGHVSRQTDTPRLLQLSKSVDGPFGPNRKHDLPSDLKKSLKVNAEVREAPWYCSESDCDCDWSLSHETKDGHSSIDAPRSSFDGKDTRSYFSSESQAISRSTLKLRDIRRLSMDGREGCMKHAKNHSNNNAAFLLRNSQPECGRCAGEEGSTTQQPSRPSGVVAKLMGLDTMPDPGSKPSGLIQQPVFEAQSCRSVLPSKINSDVCRPIRHPKSPRILSRREPSSPRWKNTDMKPVSSAKFPIEPAPWKYHEGGVQASQKQAPRLVKTIESTSNCSPSVYSEIEKRLKDLEFKQSGKDLRALKQILEGMQIKGLLGNPKEEPSSNVQRGSKQSFKCSNLSDRLVKPYKLQENYIGASGSAPGGATSSSSSSSFRAFESPIVIMKPAKLVQKSGVVYPSSILPIDCLRGVRSFHDSETANPSKHFVSRDQASRDAHTDQGSTTIDKKANTRTLLGSQCSTRSKKVSKGNIGITSSFKSGNTTTSPRFQQKKQELDRRSRPPTPPDCDGKSRRESFRQSIDTSESPGGRRKLKAMSMLQNDDILLNDACSGARKLKFQGTVIDLIQASDSRGGDTDVEEVTSYNNGQSVEVSSNIRLSEVMIPKHMDEGDVKIPSLRSREEVAAIGVQHPSPVSVLDESAYRGDSPSPVKETPQKLGDSAQDQKDGDNRSCKDGGSRNISKMNQNKLQTIDELVQKLRRLNSSHDEAQTDYIASLCDDNNSSNPDHRYISEILLASGLLLRDLSSGLGTIQLHPSGHPINPELFFVLEQTKACNPIHENVLNPSNLEKLRRKLIFDAVNEILATKIVSTGWTDEPWLKPANKLARKTLNAQKLLKELCKEVEGLGGCGEKKDLDIVEDTDELKIILLDDVMKRSDDWVNLYGNFSGVVLDIERSIFKGLVDEIVIGEGKNFLPTRRCSRQLFSIK